jgi:ribosomal protein L36
MRSLLKFYRRPEAAAELLMSQSSLDILIQTRQCKVVRRGRRIFIPASEVQRLKARSLPRIWPPKVNGKSTRHVPAKPPRRASSRQREKPGAHDDILPAAG